MKFHLKGTVLSFQRINIDQIGYYLFIERVIIHSQTVLKLTLFWLGNGSSGYVTLETTIGENPSQLMCCFPYSEEIYMSELQLRRYALKPQTGDVIFILMEYAMIIFLTQISTLRRLNFLPYKKRKRNGNPLHPQI